MIMKYIGHETILHSLETLLQSKDRPRGFLFDGPRHVGKRTVAEHLARELMGSAQGISTLWPDLLVIEPVMVSSTKQKREQLITVESIREAQKFLSLSPVGGKGRVLIIDGAEKLGIGAANALLKILEEPPEKSSILLLSAEPGLLPPTLLSRVISFHFRPVPGDLIRTLIPEAAALPQFFTDLGLPGLVLRALADEEQFVQKKDALRQLFQLSKLSWRERSLLADTLARDEIQTRELLEIWCTGLVFQVRQKASALTGHYTFLEELLKSLRSLSVQEGGVRPILEKLFLSL